MLTSYRERKREKEREREREREREEAGDEVSKDGKTR